MAENDIKQQFASTAARIFQSLYPEKYLETGAVQLFSESFISDSLEKPKDPKMGRYSFPVFRFGKLLGEKPPEIARKFENAFNDYVKTENSAPSYAISTINAFINITTDAVADARKTLTDILSEEQMYGSSTQGRNQRMLVEYSAPNIAKPFGIGHIRTTILGNSLRRIYRKLGYDVVGINYLGDWGTQFGKMLYAYKNWHDPSLVGNETVNDLLALYVRFHDEAENSPELDDAAREEFKRLEQGNEENLKLWERFREISLAEFNRVYAKIGIEFDWVTGEAFLEDKMAAVIERLEKAGLTSISDGALIVDLKDEQLPPVLLRKADGATLYATRDIAGFLYRQEKYDFHESLYVVATNQSVHFQQIFRTIELLEEAENIPSEKRFSHKAHHVNFGLIKFGKQMMATRKGNIIYLEDVIDRAAALVKEKIIEKNPSLDKIDETALSVGLGAVLFSQMSVRRQKEVNFVWEEVLNFEGETGPYLQYTHARLSSLLRNGGVELDVSKVDYSLLNYEEEKRVVELLMDFPQAVIDAGRLYDPNMIANHLLKLAGAFNSVYQRKNDEGRTDKIISENTALTMARLSLVKAVLLVLREGLYLLGIQAPEEM